MEKKHFFSFKEISYKSVLILSVIIFFVGYLLDILLVPEFSETIFIAGYVLAILLAALWSILNYIDHLRLNPRYKNYTSIASFVKDLRLDPDEKEEIQQMMEDYVEDQTQLGVSQAQAAEEIIQQFKTTELQESGPVFYFHAHLYLIGLGLLLILLGIATYLLEVFIPSLESPALVVLETTLLCYGAGFLLVFVMYQLLNRILDKK